MFSYGLSNMDQELLLWPHRGVALRLCSMDISSIPSPSFCEPWSVDYGFLAPYPGHTMAWPYAFAL